MRFYGKGILWDNENNRRLCKFKDGFFDTEDKDKIEKLKAAGYKSDDCTVYESEDEIVYEFKGVDYDSMNVVELRDAARDKGISIYSDGKALNKAALIEALKG